MADNSSALVLPNPYTPLAFLPPDLAKQFEVSRYLYAATLGAYIWDIAVNLSSDYKLLFKCRICLPTVVYYGSRVSTLAYIITSFIFQVSHVAHCQALQIALGICTAISQMCTTALFLLRARAVWQNNIYVRVFLTILWLGVVGGVMTSPIGITGAHIGPTMQCINTGVQTWVEASPISVVIFDTTVFTSIAYRILQNSIYEEGTRVRVLAFFGSRKAIPSLSRALLIGGQKYYLFAVSWGLAVIILMAETRLPAVYRVMCTIPALATMSAMACTVFRQIKFGLTEADGTPTAVQGLNNKISLELQAFKDQVQSVEVHGHEGTQGKHLDVNHVMDIGNQVV